jgi:hypothetical protein
MEPCVDGTQDCSFVCGGPDILTDWAWWLGFSVLDRLSLCLPSLTFSDTRLQNYNYQLHVHNQNRTKQNTTILTCWL